MTDTQQTQNIYRFKFTDQIMDYLTSFAKQHQYVDRKTYKEAWLTWINENEDIISEECCRLEKLGYDGDVKDKMFKACRYYFRKKPNNKPEPKSRKNYVTIDPEILMIMDEHIRRNMDNADYSPAKGYSNFCEVNMNNLIDEVGRLVENGLSKDEIAGKIKKTYKNRYFIISRN